MNRTHLLLITCTLAKPVTTDLEREELMLTGPSPWKILILASFIGSIVSTSAKPSTPETKIHIITYIRYIASLFTGNKFLEQLLDAFRGALQKVRFVNLACLNPISYKVRKKKLITHQHMHF